MDSLVIPGDSLSLSSFDMLAKQNSTKLQHILEQAAANSASAPKGSPLQQGGDFFASGMDLDRLKAPGVKPLQHLALKRRCSDETTGWWRGASVSRLLLRAVSDRCADVAICKYRNTGYILLGM